MFYRTNAQSRSFEEAARARRIPYRLIGSVRFYDRKEVKDVLAYLKLLVNPDEDTAFLRVVNLPRREIRHEPENTTCGCGTPMQRIGEDVSEKLDIIPAKFFVHRHIYGKWVCRCCQTLKQAPAVPELIDGGIDAGGALAASLRNASPAVLKQITALNAQVEKQANLTGVNLAGQVFNGRIATAQRAAAQPVVLRLDTDGSAWSRLMVAELRKAVRAAGGNVQLVLGARA